MAINALAVWEIRPSSGSVNNGGFYVPGSSGTDFSQQTSPQYAITGGTTSGASATLLTALAAADMVGNGLKLVSGTNGTVGWYHIVSVVAGTSITVDRNLTSGAGASIVANVGGAISSPVDFYNNLASGNTGWMTGTFTTSSNFAPTSSTLGGTNSGTPTALWGYGSARGDGTKATWTTATNSTKLISLGFNSPYNFQWKWIKFSNTATTRAAGFDTNGSTTCGMWFQRCEFDGFTTAIDGSGNSGFLDMFIHATEVHNCTSHGIQNNGSTSIMDSWIHNNTGDGFKVTGQSIRSTTFVLKSVFYANANGINNQNTQNMNNGNNHISFMVEHCAFSDNTAAGILFALGTTEVMFVRNTIFYNNTTYGINMGEAPVFYESTSNAFGANGTASTNNWTTSSSDISLSADPFTARASADFTLNSTTGGGASCKGAGWPGVSLFGTGHVDIGPLQTSSAGGSTVIVVNQNLTRFIVEPEA